MIPSAIESQPTAGIDVGGPAKGFHAVVLRGSSLLGKFHSRRASEVAAWCVGNGATVIAVDAPCLWRRAGHKARAAERELAKQRISCFSTPTEDAARGHAFFTWMFAGMEMFQALASTHPLYLGQANTSAVAIESFPQAAACALAGEIVSAKEKNSVRRALLTRKGVDVSRLSNIDEVDAALCAIAAQAFASGAYQAYGDAEGGFIITPRWSPRSFSSIEDSPVAPKVTPRTALSFAKLINALPSLTAKERKILRERLDAIDSHPI